MTIDEIISAALYEDLGEGDHTSLACVAPQKMGEADLIMEEQGTIAGIELAERIFHRLDQNVQMERRKEDGDQVEPEDIVFRATGPTHALLQAERLVLNCMQRMSGIATKTKQAVEAVKGFPATILDTRKTTPCIRPLEKWAVRIGGGKNHRQGLYDAILIKDNHIDHAGGIAPAIKAANHYLEKHQRSLPRIIEARSPDELNKILETGGVDRILMDNFSYTDLEKGVKTVNGHFETEASGNITPANARAYAQCGVDFLSMGCLTHSPGSLDMALKAVKEHRTTANKG